MNIGPTGIWQCETTEPHTFDKGLFMEILEFCREYEVESVADLGCGSGKYVDALNDADIAAVGYDGNANTASFSVHCKGNVDLTQPISNGGSHMVLSLEVGEHIPREFEMQFLDNIANNAEMFVVLSWFPIPGHGIGHVNERENSWVIDQMFQRGFFHIGYWSDRMRKAATSWWFKHSVMAIIRK